MFDKIIKMIYNKENHNYDFYYLHVIKRRSKRWQPLR